MNVQFEQGQHFDCSFDSGDGFDVGFDGNVRVEDYSGPYTVTPSSEQQVLSTADMMVRQNIVVEAIPNNYGLITWNGVTLTVS